MSSGGRAAVDGGGFTGGILLTAPVAAPCSARGLKATKGIGGGTGGAVETGGCCGGAFLRGDWVIGGGGGGCVNLFCSC